MPNEITHIRSQATTLFTYATICVAFYAVTAVALPSVQSSLTIRPGHEFAADSYVHRPLPANTEVDPKSDLWVADLQRQIKKYYGTASVNFETYSPPVYIVGRDQPTVRVRARRSSNPNWSFPPLQGLWNEVPIPDDFTPASGGDHEAIVYQPSTGMYWEFWLLEQTGSKATDSTGRSVDEWRAAWGGRIDDLRTNSGFFATTPEGYKLGTAATGLVLLAGLITIEEQRRGVIDHALHFAIPEARASVWTYPAQRTDGTSGHEDAIPQGVTFRLPADLDLDAIDMDPYARMIARAVQKYGMVLRDMSGSVNFYAENPSNRYSEHPYYGRDGILRCPEAVYDWSCSTNSRLRGFPWALLQALKVTLSNADSR